MDFNSTFHMPKLGNDISAAMVPHRACVVLHQGAKGSQLPLLSRIITLFKRQRRPNNPRGRMINGHTLYTRLVSILTWDRGHRVQL